ncbi:4'-phosphopantetheinyl transferase family protein [Streptomyces sp. NPDC059786]|uniref:4'-phosphopantetheinyl transferase family protein n=1 Tax=Streptomyces sp. NPDC059786 TaxID=3346946 RepID=UPI00364B5D65
MTRVTPEVRPGPPAGEVHVWRVPEPGAADAETLRRCAALLAPDERRRREHMVPSQRALYASAHAALRLVTAAYTGTPPTEVAFLRGSFGKPYVSGHPGLRVSLAHTAGLSLVAVGRDGPVGVDVERLAPLRDPAGLRRQILTGTEAAHWPEEPEDAPHSALFTYWTCKEAVLKAMGSGLAGDLRAVRVAVPGTRRAGPVRLLAVPGSPARTWRLHLLDVGTPYRAAVAVAGGGDTVRLLRLRLPGETGRAGDPAAEALAAPHGTEPPRTSGTPPPCEQPGEPGRYGRARRPEPSGSPGSPEPSGRSRVVRARPAPAPVPPPARAPSPVPQAPHTKEIPSCS